MISNYFHIIDTEEKAYWLGFLYADGCIERNLKHIKLELSIVDEEHLKKFVKTIKSTNKISNNSKNTSVRTTICCKEMCVDLCSKGCVPAKSLILSFPSADIIPDNLINHFIRGYFDGDGCISLSTAKRHRKELNPNKVYVSHKWFFRLLGTEDMLNGIIKNLPVNLNIKSIKTSKIKYIQCGGKYIVQNIMNYIYNDATIYLERKYLKYKELFAP